MGNITTAEAKRDGPQLSNAVLMHLNEWESRYIRLTSTQLISASN